MNTKEKKTLDSKDNDTDLLFEEKLPKLHGPRLIFIIVCFFLAFSVLTVRLTYHIFFNNSKQIAKKQYNFSNYIHRKEIIDRNGIVLAVNLATASIYANPHRVLDPREAAAKLNKIFPDLSYKYLLSLLNSKKKFVWIKRNLTPKEQYAVNYLGLPGIEFDNAERRMYPYGNVFSHLVGYVSHDNRGIAGLEKYFDQFLTSNAGNIEEEHLQLSLDVRAQNIVYDELSATIKEYKAEGGIGFIMNANNGEIVSMVNLPDFDPHNPGKAKDYQLFNKATLGTYELGSVFKLCTVAMALESKATTLKDVYYVKDPIKISRFTIKDFRPKGLKRMSVPQILMHSSNIGTVKIGLEVGTERQKQFLKLFGMFEPIDIELPEKGYPLYPKHWGLIHTMTISFGHGISVTPLHMISIIGALVNGGNLYNPTLIKIKNDQMIKSRKVLSESTSEKMRRLLRLIVTNGAGRKADVGGYLVGGKTGTAEKVIKGGYNRNARISSFIGAFPMHQPQYVIFILVDNPKPNAKTPFATGGFVAAPTVSRIISRLGPVLGIRPWDDKDPKIQKQLWLEYDPNETIDKL